MTARPLLTTLIGSVGIFLVARLTVAHDLTNVIDPELWQLTAPDWIAGRSLWSTILSFHAQPPGLIMLQWAAANLTPGIIEISMLIAAVLFVCCCGASATMITDKPAIGLLSASIVAFQPETLLYSHWFFSPIYLAAFVALNLTFVLAWARTGNAAWLSWATFVLALASLFHSAYFVAFVIVVCMILLYPPVRRFEIRRPVFVIPLAIAASIAIFTPVKNFIVYGFFSTSSWAPLNIANVYTNEHFIWQKCQSRILESKRRRGDYGTSKAAAYRNTLNPDMLFRPVKPGGTVNLNHLDVMQCVHDVRFFEQFDTTSAALNIIRSVSEAVALPAWDYQWLGTQNLKKIEFLVKLYELFSSRADKVEYRYYVDIEKRPENWLESLPSLTSVFLSVAVIFGCVTLLAQFAQNLRRSGRIAAGETARRNLALVYPCAFALLILAIFVFASGQELNRAKFSLTPLFIAVVLEALRRCAACETPAWLRWLRFLHPGGQDALK